MSSTKPLTILITLILLTGVGIASLADSEISLNNNYNNTAISHGMVVDDVATLEYEHTDEDVDELTVNVRTRFDTSTGANYTFQYTDETPSEMDVGDTEEIEIRFNTNEWSNEEWDVMMDESQFFLDVAVTGDGLAETDDYLWLRATEDAGFIVGGIRNALNFFYNAFLEPLISPFSGLLEAISSAVNALQDLLISAVWATIDLIIYSVFIVLDITFTIVGSVITITGNALQFLVFYHTDTGVEYNGTVYDSLENSSADFSNILDGDVSLVENKTQSDFFNSPFGTNESDRSFINYYNTVNILEYELRELDSFFNATEPDNGENNGDTGTGTEIYELNITEPEDLNELQEDGFDTSMSFGDGMSIDPIGHAHIEGDTDSSFDRTSRVSLVEPVNLTEDMHELNVTAFKQFSHREPTELIITSEIEDISSTETLTDSLDLQEDLDENDESTVTFEDSEGDYVISSGTDSITLDESDIEENDLHITLEWVDWEDEMDAYLFYISHDMTGEFIENENDGNETDNGIDNGLSVISIDMPFPKMVEDLGLPLGSIILINVTITLLAGLWSLTPNVIQDIFTLLFTAGMTILTVATDIIVWVTSAINFIFNEGFFLLKWALYGYVGFKSLYYAELLWKATDSTNSYTYAQAFNELFTDLEHILFRINDLAHQSFVIMTHAVNTVTHFINMVRGMFRGL